MRTTADVIIIGGGISGCSAAYQLARRGARVRLLEKNHLAAGSPLCYKDQSDKTALDLATFNQNEEIVRLLLTQKDDDVNVNAQSSFGGTALMSAAYNGNLAIVDMLLRAGADPSLLTDQSLGAIGYAATGGHVEIIYRLIEAGAASPNERLGRDGDTTELHMASVTGNLALVQALLNAGADPTALNGNGKTPADLAGEKELFDIAELLERAARDYRRSDTKSPFRSEAS